MRRWWWAIAGLMISMGLGAQGLLMDPGSNGMGVRVRAELDLAGFRSAGVASGYSVSGILDLGLDMGVAVGHLEGSPATDVDISCYLDVIPLKQSATFPLSVRLYSSYGLVVTTSEYLDINHLNRRAFGYTFGVGLYSNIYFVRFLGVQLGAFGQYGATHFTVETHGAAVAGYPRSERVSEIIFGGELGVLVRTSQNTVYSVHLAVELDPSFAMVFVPSVSISTPGR